MILILIVNPSLAPSTETSVQGFALAIERIKLYPQGILLISKLFGDISSIAPERELVRIGGGRVRKSEAWPPRVAQSVSRSGAAETQADGTWRAATRRIRCGGEACLKEENVREQLCRWCRADRSQPLVNAIQVMYGKK